MVYAQTWKKQVSQCFILLAPKTDVSVHDLQVSRSKPFLLFLWCSVTGWVHSKSEQLGSKTMQLLCFTEVCLWPETSCCLLCPKLLWAEKKEQIKFEALCAIPRWLIYLSAKLLNCLGSSSVTEASALRWRICDSDSKFSQIYLPILISFLD